MDAISQTLGGLHICQRMAYQWILADIGYGKLTGQRVLDFGPNGYPLLALLALRDAEAYWVDRDPICAKKMAGLERDWHVSLLQTTLDAAPQCDIIIAPNAIQHNHDGAEDIYRALANALKLDGRFYVVEALTWGQSYWNDKHPAPHWVRTLPEHKALWHEAGLNLAKMGFFAYTYSKNRALECGEWTDERKACRVIARLERPCA